MLLLLVAATQAFAATIIGIDQVTPAHLPNYKESQLTVEGAGFLKSSIIRINGEICKDMVFHSQKKMTCTARPSPEPALLVTVTNALGTLIYKTPLSTYSELKITSKYDTLTRMAVDKYEVSGGVPPYSFEKQEKAFSFRDDTFSPDFDGEGDLIVKDSVGNEARKRLKIVEAATGVIECNNGAEDRIHPIHWQRPGDECEIHLAGGMGGKRMLAPSDDKKSWIDVSEGHFKVPAVSGLMSKWRLLDEYQMSTDVKPSEIASNIKLAQSKLEYPILVDDGPSFFEIRNVVDGFTVNQVFTKKTDKHWVFVYQHGDSHLNLGFLEHERRLINYASVALPKKAPLFSNVKMVADGKDKYIVVLANADEGTFQVSIDKNLSEAKALKKLSDEPCRAVSKSEKSSQAYLSCGQSHFGESLYVVKAGEEAELKKTLDKTRFKLELFKQCKELKPFMGKFEIWATGNVDEFRVVSNDSSKVIKFDAETLKSKIACEK